MGLRPIPRARRRATSARRCDLAAWPGPGASRRSRPGQAARPRTRSYAVGALAGLAGGGAAGCTFVED